MTITKRTGLIGGASALGLLIAAVVISGLVFLSGAYFDTRENVEYRCLIDDAQPNATSETALISAQATLWPAGRRCEWRADDGSLIVTQTGWPASIAFAVAVLLLLLYLAVALTLRLRARNHPAPTPRGTSSTSGRA